MSNIFQNVVSEKKKRYNNFNLSREVLVSGQIGKLIPVQCDEVVPGDFFNENAAYLMRFAPLSAPAMARFNVHFHSFYVPYRIITDEAGRESTWERFIKSIGKSSEEVPVLPFIHGDVGSQIFQLFDVGTLWDYLGYPILTKSLTLNEDDRISIMPFLAYQSIYQNFYRRDQLEEELIFPINVGGISTNGLSTVNSWTDDDVVTFDGIQLEDNQVFARKGDIFRLRTRNYERDYFTSALPEPQFGDEVAIGDGLVNWIGDTSQTLAASFEFDRDIFQSQLSVDTSTVTTSSPLEINAFVAKYPDVNNSLLSYGFDIDSPVSFLGSTFNLQTDISGPGSFELSKTSGEKLASRLQSNTFTINELRLAMQLQAIKEKINRVGTRYLEIMEGIYGVRVPDARLQRPIYLGGFKAPATIGSVMQTSETLNTPQGTLTGQMSSSATNRLCNGRYMFVEHGYLMTIMSVTPRTSYYGGIPRKYTKSMPEDFYLPQFDHLGEQEIKKRELYFGANDADNETFGYTPRYAELKSALSSVHGEFRTTLENWHVSRDFDSAPSLNPDFIQADPQDFDRIFQFQNIERTSNEHFYCQIFLDVRAKRNMSKYSTPYTFY